MTPVPPYSGGTGGTGGGQTEAQVQAKVDAAVAALVDGSPGALDTLNELAAALGDDAAFSAHVTTAIGNAQSAIDDHLSAGTGEAHTAVQILTVGTPFLGQGLDLETIIGNIDIVLHDAANAAGDANANALAAQQSVTDHEASEHAHTAASIDFNGLDGLTDVQQALTTTQQNLVNATNNSDTALGTANSAQTAITDHIADTTDAHAAGSIKNTPAGGIAAVTVQAALNELDTEKATTGSVTTVANAIADHIADTSDAHDASAISVLDSGNHFAGTDVEAVLAELAGASGGGGSIAPDAQVLTGAGNWTKPLNARVGGTTTVIAIGGGAGGGRGGIDAAGTTRAGGGGGGAGGLNVFTFPTARLDATEPFSVGAAGAGGTGMDPASQLGGKVGLPGSNGGNTTFGKAASLLVQAGGGQAGSGGGASTAQSYSVAMAGSGVNGIGPAGHGGGGAFHNPLMANGQSLPARGGSGFQGPMGFPGGDFIGRMFAKVTDVAQPLTPVDISIQITGVGGAGGGAASDTSAASGTNSGGGRGGGSLSTGNLVRTTGAATSTTQLGQARQGGDGGAASAVNTVNGSAGTNGTGPGAGGGGGGAATAGGTAVSGNGGAGTAGYLLVITEVE